ncbi:MAG: tetratricopeptide repeat protein [Planctomycetota bacterium]
MLITRENLEGAVVELDAALKDRERLTAAQRANLYYQTSRYYDKRRSPKAAITMLQQCLVEQPDHTDALIALAYRIPWNELDKAMGYVEKSIQADPTNWQGPYHRAAFYLRAGRHDDALRELQRAETELGGAGQTSLLQLRGQVLYAAKRYDDGRAAYQQALAIDPDSLDTRLALADYFARTKNTGGALMEYAQILRDHVSEPLAHERYGRFLRTIPARRAEGIASMTRAAKLSLEQRGAPAPGLLRDLARALRTEPKLRAQARVAALLLYRYWPGWRGTAHQELGQVWKLDGRQAIAHAHVSAAAALGRPLLIGKPAAKALTAADAISLVRAGYSMDVYSDVVASTNLGFPVQAATVKQLMSAGLPVQLMPQLALRSIRDQASGGKALASLVKITFEGSVQSKSKRGPWSTVKFTNTGGVPLNGLQLKYSYQDANKKSLFSATHVYALKRGPLLPGTTRKVRFLWHDWKVLKERTKDTKKIKWYALEAVHARNAEFLARVKLVGGFAKDSKSYRFTIQNNSAFNVRKLSVRCDFLDTKNQPILAASGDAIGETIPVTDLTLKPGQKSGELTVKSWADWNHLARLGISRTRYKTVRVRVRVVDGVAFFDKKGT